MADDDGRVHRAVQGGRLIEVQREVEKHLGVELGATGVWPLVEGHVYSADMVERPKPAPDLFLHAARSLGFEPAHCVVIEDRATGICAACAAGMRVVGLASPGDVALSDARGHTVINQLSELTKYHE